MEIEKLLKVIVENYDQKKADVFFESLLEKKLYFFFTEQNSKDTHPREGSAEIVLLIDKEKPIYVPLIETENGKNGVLYTNSELAKKTEFECKIGKMKGKKAFDMFCDIKNLHGAYVQGNYGNILLTKSDLKRYLKMHNKALQGTC